MDLLTQNVQTILEQHPKVKQELLTWQKKGLQLFQTTTAELAQEKTAELPPIDDEMTLQFLLSSFIFNPRSLYEFFDEQKMFIVILPVEEGFRYKIDGIEQEETFSHRIAAEQDAFKKAIKNLETKLL